MYPWCEICERPIEDEWWVQSKFGNKRHVGCNPKVKKVLASHGPSDDHVWEWKQTPENKYVGRYICAVCGQQQSKSIRSRCFGSSTHEPSTDENADFRSDLRWALDKLDRLPDDPDTQQNVRQIRTALNEYPEPWEPTNMESVSTPLKPGHEPGTDDMRAAGEVMFSVLRAVELAQGKGPLPALIRANVSDAITEWWKLSQPEEPAPDTGDVREGAGRASPVGGESGHGEPGPDAVSAPNAVPSPSHDVPTDANPDADPLREATHIIHEALGMAPGNGGRAQALAEHLQHVFGSAPSASVDAIRALIEAAEHTAKAGHGQGCDAAVADPGTGGARECGGCWPCVLKILGQRATAAREAVES